MSNKEKDQVNVGQTEERHQMCFEQHHETTPAEKVVGDVSAYRALVEETQKTSQCGRNETTAIYVDPIVDPKMDELVVNKKVRPGIIVFVNHQTVSFDLSNFAGRNGFTYENGGNYNDGRLVKISGHLGQFPSDLRECIEKAGFVPFDDLPNHKYRFVVTDFKMAFNLNLVIATTNANTWVEREDGKLVKYVTFTTDYQHECFMTLLHEAGIKEWQTSSRWDK